MPALKDTPLYEARVYDFWYNTTASDYYPLKTRFDQGGQFT